jgi:hypothetical protein
MDTRNPRQLSASWQGIMNEGYYIWRNIEAGGQQCAL